MTQFYTSCILNGNIGKNFTHQITEIHVPVIVVVSFVKFTLNFEL